MVEFARNFIISIVVALAGAGCAPSTGGSYEVGPSSAVLAMFDSVDTSSSVTTPALAAAESPSNIMQYSINSGSLSFASRALAAYKHGITRPGMFPTALTRTGGSSCALSGGVYACDGTISGTTDCPGGGTSTWNDVGINLNLNQNTFNGLIQITSGSMTYSSCVVSYFDLITEVYTTATINGTVSDISLTTQNIGTNVAISGSSGSYDLAQTSTTTMTFSDFTAGTSVISDGTHTTSLGLVANIQLSNIAATGDGGNTFNYVQTMSSGSYTFDGMTVKDFAGVTLSGGARCDANLLCTAN